MLTLVSGGAASGKSEYAESLALSDTAHSRIYLATMEVWDKEGEARIARHRQLRQGKGFQTLEIPRNLIQCSVPRDSCVLLECLSNLCANECFGSQGFLGAEERILSGISHLQSQCASLIIVTNELFSDGISYAPETARYCAILESLNCQLAAKASHVYEVVCGIPICWKGGAP